VIGLTEYTLRIDPRLRAALYALMTVLFVTGVAWLVVDRLRDSSGPQTGQAVAASLLMLHGGTAMLVLLVLGAIIPLHVRGAWRSRRNRATGVVMLASNAVLIVTAFGLYYLGSETLRHWTSALHVAVGLGIPILLTFHVLLGKRSLRYPNRRFRTGVVSSLHPTE
jgi:cation transport ATPase